MSILHDFAVWAPLGVPATIFVLGAVVFFHELGHFLVARACGVNIDTFSIGFGGEIFGWTDKKGTRWKVSWLPLGGYVKFSGDANAMSVPDAETLAKMTEAEKAGAFPLKPLWQRALVVAAGPLANFVLAFVVFTVLFAGFGTRGMGTVIGSVTQHSPAAEAGLQRGDKIVAVDGKEVRFFQTDLIDAVQGAKSSQIVLTILRGSQTRDVTLTPRILKPAADGGNAKQNKAIGVSPEVEKLNNLVYIPVPLAKAPVMAAEHCWAIASGSLTMAWRMLSQKADTSQLGGPIRIAAVAKSAADYGLYPLFLLVGLISVSIGLINLFPIPLLDGGHLLYYAFEGVRGRPLSAKAQDVGFSLGLALVLGLMIFATWNDLSISLGGSRPTAHGTAHVSKD